MAAMILARSVPRVAAPARQFSTGATFARVKIPNRPTITELSGGQNKVLMTAEEFSCNTTPTWQKGKTDKQVNYVAAGFFFGGCALLARVVTDLTLGTNKIEGR